MDLFLELLQVIWGFHAEDNWHRILVLLDVAAKKEGPIDACEHVHLEEGPYQATAVKEPETPSCMEP